MRKRHSLLIPVQLKDNLEKEGGGTRQVDINGGHWDCWENEENDKTRKPAGGQT